MSLWDKLMGGRFGDHRDQAEALFKEGRFKEAKVAFERALARARGVPPEQLEAVRSRVRACQRALALDRIQEADQLALDGDLASAEERLTDALAICAEPEVALAVKERRMRYESDDARRLVEAEDEIDEEELLTILAGTWTESQAEEYAALPDPFEAALLAGHDGDHDRELELLRSIADRTDLPVTPRYLFFAIGKACHALGRFEDAIAAFDSFFSRVEPAEAPDLHVEALAIKAAALSGLERYDEARAQLDEATRIKPEDHTVFLGLGAFLRARGEYEQAQDALNLAVELMGQMHPDFRVIRELGFTYLAMGRADEAERSLGAVIEHLASRGEHDQFDPEAAVALARLYEARGALMQAADLFRHLATGYDTRHHGLYNLEAARLLRSAGADPGLVERYRTRGAELAQGEEERALLAELEA